MRFIPGTGGIHSAVLNIALWTDVRMDDFQRPGEQIRLQ